MRSRLIEEVRGKRVTVVGLAKSGYAAALLLGDLGATVTVTEKNPAEKISVDLQELTHGGVRMELGGHTRGPFLSADLLVVSPGVDLRMPLLQEARAAGVPLWSEVELAYRATEATFIGVTGTNGKSTTTRLIGALLTAARYPTTVAGNIGTPLCQVVPGLPREHLVVAELSSFQLEATVTFTAKVALLLNLSPDHLDRYASEEDYYAAKARIFSTQGPEDFAILNADDPLVLRWASPPSRRILFSRRSRVEDGAWLEGTMIWMGRGGRAEKVCGAEELQIHGVHNLENALAAAAVAAVLGVEPEVVAQALCDFRGLPHRLEFVGEFGGVRYVNDSKGTNVGAVIKSLESFHVPVVLIAGGREKGSDFTPLAPAVKGKVRTLILIGEAKERLRAQLAGCCPMEEAATMEEAVEKAAAVARAGDVVLLSPACASFDMFRDFEERGQAFTAAAHSRPRHTVSR